MYKNVYFYFFNNFMLYPFRLFLLFFTLVFFSHIQIIYLPPISSTNLKWFELLKTILVKSLYSKIILLFIERILKLAFDSLKFQQIIYFIDPNIILRVNNLHFQQNPSACPLFLHISYSIVATVYWSTKVIPPMHDSNHFLLNDSWRHSCNGIHLSYKTP